MSTSAVVFNPRSRTIFASLNLPFSSVTFVLSALASMPITSISASVSVPPPAKNCLSLALAVRCACTPLPITLAPVPTIVAVLPAIQPFQPALITPSSTWTIFPALLRIAKFVTSCSPISPIASDAGDIIALPNALPKNFFLIGPPYATLFCIVSATPPIAATA